ncbi:MAG TPA: hypothetical protein VFJ89_12290 [Nocardioides sp.]|nr:hypothetical protein [Nocardioides sp.]
MTDLTDVLRRATDDLTPEAPDLLLARAVRRGARLRRRRRLVTAGGIGGAAAAACVAVAVLTASPFGHPASSGPADPGPTTAAPTRPTSPPSLPAAPHVTVPRSAFGSTFATVLPGTVTDEHDTPAGRVPDEDGYASTFDWNGYRVSLMIAPYHGDSHARCLSAVHGSLGTQSCVRVPGGWAVHDAMMTDTDLNRWVSVYRDNGFRMWVLIYNSGSEKGSAAAGPPPLDVPDLEQVATSDLWFS